MTEKNKLLLNLIEKSGKNKEDIEIMIQDKINELSGLVSEEGALYIIANDLGIKLDSDKPKKNEQEFKKIEAITQASVPISFISKIVKKYDKINFSSQNSSEGSVQSILVGDETGIIRIVFWHDKTEILENLQENDIIKIINAYTRENNNSKRIEVHFGQYSDIEVNPKNEKIELKEFNPSQIDFTEKKIDETIEGDKNVKIKGVITSFEIPRFYLACPECFKKVFQDEEGHKCAVHETVKAIKVPIINILIDDGSSSIEAIAFRDRAEKITKLNSEKIILLTEDIEEYNNFSKEIIGTSIELGGNISLSTFSGEKQFLVNQIILIDNNIKKKTEKKAETETKNKQNNDDDLDIEIEEINIDDDLL